MPICPTCFAKYPADTSTCSTDGTALVPDETFAHVDKDVTEGMVVGEYRIEAKIGEGGFGAVYRAVHPLIGKMAAVKVLSRQFSSNPQMVSRFVQEARAVNQIRHRNIIDIFSFGQLPDGRQYYIMELLEGSSFDQYIAKKKRLPLGEAIPILRSIARALDAAHAKGILHRDLKPENVYLVFDEDGRIEPKLLDFGLVKLLAATTTHHKTKTGTPMGTPYYMSPEQCRGLEVDARTDVYSFAALIFEVITGEVPFRGESAMDILIQHMTAPPPRASERCPEIPPEVDAVLARMMSKEPAERPARVGEAIDLLAKAASFTSGISSFVSSPPVNAVNAGNAFITQGSPAATDSERAIATTLMADPSMTPAPAHVTPAPVHHQTGAPVHHQGPGHVSAGRIAGAVGGAAPGQTFLGAETDVSSSIHAPRRSRGLVVGAAVGIAGLIGVVAVVVTLNVRKPQTTNVVQAAKTTTTTTAAVASTPTPTPTPTSIPTPVVREEVDLVVDGAPDGTTVTSNGVELGKVPGPFKLKMGAPAKLAFVAKGYKTKELTITPTDNVHVPVSLDKAAAVSGAGGGGGRKPTTPGTTINPDLEGFDKK